MACLVAALAGGATLAAHAQSDVASARWPVLEVGAAKAGQVAGLAFEGVVEPVRQTVLAAQIAGALVQLQVKAGDSVRAGQVLARIEAQAAEQNVAASSAQVEAARAAAAVADKEFERQRQLFQKQYISQAALDRAASQAEAAQAQLRAAQAQTRAAQVQSGFFVLRAPYAGVVSDVAVTQGDMVLPGRPLLTLHDPRELRISAAVPQNLLATVQAHLKSLRYDIPGQTAQPLAPASVQLLPTVDAQTHTARVRLVLPAGGQAGVVPGLFARVWLPGQAVPGALERVFLPETAVLRRAELTAVYVLDAQGQPRLRQVRLGQAAGGQVEVLSGLASGERVVRDPRSVGAAR